MSEPSLLRFSVQLRLEEMRAYVMQAFTPEQVAQSVDSAFESALAAFPAYVKQEMQRAMQETARKAVGEAVSSWVIKEEVRKALEPLVLRAFATAISVAADAADKRRESSS